MLEGRLILDRFELEEELGRGGHGIVFRAHDRRLQRDVAVKVLDGGAAGRRVLREAQAAARLNHPSIVTLYELGEDGSSVYLVSEFVDGDGLGELIGQGQLADREVADAAAELCEALEHAHEQGVIHRDVKPENIVISRWDDSRVGPWSRARPGRAMLMDFGIASVAGADHLTRTGEVLGTLAYMAPEQAEGSEVGPEADVYSLGLVLYECWSGVNPVRRPTPAATARAIGSRLPALAQHRPDLAEEVTEVVDACLDPDPAERPLLAELREELGFVRSSLDPSPRSHEAPGRLSGLRALPGGARLVLLTAELAALAAIAFAAGQGGLALVLGILALPAPLLFDRPRDWVTPLAAPALGLLSAASLYPALAGVSGGVRRAMALGLLGWVWLAVFSALVGEPLLVDSIDPAGTGWETSPAAAAAEVLAPLLSPIALAFASTWAVGAGLLAALLGSRGLAIRAVGALIWGAGSVALHRLLVEDGAEPAGVVVVGALAVILLTAVWASAERSPTASRRDGAEPRSAAFARGAA